MTNAIQTTVLIPTRNARPFVEAAVASCLQETGGGLEVLVIDDGSTDGSADVVRAMRHPLKDRVRIIDGPRQGISAAMNAGLAAARGTYLCRCDADDLFPPARLARQLNLLRQLEPEGYGAVCGSFSTITHAGRPVADLDCGAAAEEITAELRDGRTRTHLGTFLVAAAALRSAGGFRPWFVTAEDIDVQLRLAGVARVWYEPVVSYVYRLHDGSITHNQPNAAREFYEAAARRFARQRRDTGLDDLQRGAPPSPPTPAGPSSAMPSSHQVQGMLVSASWKQHKAGQKARAMATGLRACMARPANVSAWKNLGALAVKRAGRK